MSFDGLLRKNCLTWRVYLYSLRKAFLWSSRGHWQRCAQPSTNYLAPNPFRHQLATLTLSVDGPDSTRKEPHTGTYKGGLERKHQKSPAGRLTPKWFRSCWLLQPDFDVGISASNLPGCHRCLCWVHSNSDNAQNASRSGAALAVFAALVSGK